MHSINTSQNHDTKIAKFFVLLLSKEIFHGFGILIHFPLSIYFLDLNIMDLESFSLLKYNSIKSKVLKKSAKG